MFCSKQPSRLLLFLLLALTSLMCLAAAWKAYGVLGMTVGHRLSFFCLVRIRISLLIDINDNMLIWRCPPLHSLGCRRLHRQQPDTLLTLGLRDKEKCILSDTTFCRRIQCCYWQKAKRVHADGCCFIVFDMCLKCMLNTVPQNNIDFNWAVHLAGQRLILTWFVLSCISLNIAFSY